MRTVVDRMYGSPRQSHERTKELEAVEDKSSNYFSRAIDNVTELINASMDHQTPNNERAITQLLENDKRYVHIVQLYKPQASKQPIPSSKHREEETKTNDLPLPSCSFCTLHKLYSPQLPDMHRT